MATTTYSDLRKIKPRSETHWRAIAARAHRLNGWAGSEAAAKTHELFIVEIRHFDHPGSTRAPKNCPRCLARGRKYFLLLIGGIDRCGTCQWPANS